MAPPLSAFSLQPSSGDRGPGTSDRKRFFGPNSAGRLIPVSCFVLPGWYRWSDSNHLTYRGHLPQPFCRQQGIDPLALILPQTCRGCCHHSAQLPCREVRFAVPFETGVLPSSRMVPVVGLEPTRPKAQHFECCVSTNSTTPARTPQYKRFPDRSAPASASRPNSWALRLSMWHNIHCASPRRRTIGETDDLRRHRELH